MSTKKRKKLSPETVRHVRTYALNNPRTKFETIAKIFGLNNASHAWAIIRRTTHRNVTGLLIPLSKGKAFAIVDETDFANVNALKWQLHTQGYGQRTVTVEKTHKTQLMHTFVLGSKEGLEIDHINSDRKDNRRCNLRFCTRTENLRSQRRAKDNKSGFKGVIREGSKWLASIKVDGANKRLGTFATKEEAAKAYDKGALLYYGAFAHLNFPKTTRGVK